MPFVRNKPANLNLTTSLQLLSQSSNTRSDVLPQKSVDDGELMFFDQTRLSIPPSSSVHPRRIKVRLESSEVGRVRAIAG